jgi:hypothetical protein
MLAHRSLGLDTNDTHYREQLEYLYARRSAIDALIESLQRYDRYRAQRSPDKSRKSA